MATYLIRKPIKPTSLTPEEIVGLDNMPLLEKHYSLSLKEPDGDKWEKLIQKKFSEAERTFIADIYEKLREHGFWPRGVDRFNNIRWAAMVRSDLQNMVESLPLVDRKDMPLSVKFKEVPNVTAAEIENEYGGE